MENDSGIAEETQTVAADYAEELFEILDSFGKEESRTRIVNGRKYPNIKTIQRLIAKQLEQLIKDDTNCLRDPLGNPYLQNVKYLFDLHSKPSLLTTAYLLGIEEAIDLFVKHEEHFSLLQKNLI